MEPTDISAGAVETIQPVEAPKDISVEEPCENIVPAIGSVRTVQAPVTRIRPFAARIRPSRNTMTYPFNKTDEAVMGSPSSEDPLLKSSDLRCNNPVPTNGEARPRPVSLRTQSQSRQNFLQSLLQNARSSARLTRDGDDPIDKSEEEEKEMCHTQRVHFQDALVTGELTNENVLSAEDLELLFYSAAETSEFKKDYEEESSVALAMNVTWYDWYH